MGSGVGIRELAWLDCAGGGQVVVDGKFAYIGHMEAPQSFAGPAEKPYSHGPLSPRRNS